MPFSFHHPPADLWQKRIWPGVMVLFALLACLATLQAHLTTHLDDGRNLTNYNNYLIFRNSFWHLVNGQDLYLKYKYEYWDIFKYTPTFALCMAPLSILPAVPGLLLWNLLNVFLLLFGLNKIPILDARMKSFIMLFALVEMMTSLQNEQSNGLVTGMLVYAFALAENRKLFFATGLIVFAAFVKLLGIAALAIFLFYPQFWRAAFYSLFWFVLFLLLPLLVISPTQFIFQYTRWFEILAADMGGSGGLSMMTVLRAWLHIDIDKMYVQLLGILIFFLPFLFIRKFKVPQQRLLFIASLLVWIVIFNHKAESPTFVIAVVGVGIWYVLSGGGWLNSLLLMLCFVFTQLSATDLFPESWQTGFFTTHAIKAVPCVLVWIKMNYDLIRGSENEQVIAHAQL